MGRLITDHAARHLKAAHLSRFAAIDKRQGARLAPLFETLYRRARTRDQQGRLLQYLAIARKG